MDALRTNPYAGVDWNAVGYHRAALHAHSAYPETEGHAGQDSPATVIDDYAGAGYSVLALTGHEYNIAAPTWPWTDWDRDPAALGMVGVQAAELGGSDGGIGHDLLSYWSDLADTTGMSVDEVLEAIGGRGGLAVFPHPSRYHDSGEWYEGFFRTHAHLLGVEVVNAADRYPTGRDVWDDLQTRLGNDRAVWGFANDDYHGRAAGYSFDRSRNVLLLEDLTAAAVREALVEGRFFYQHVVESADEDGGDGGDIDESGDGGTATADGDDGSRYRRPAADALPPVIEAIDHEEDAGRLRVAATGADEIQWASEGAVVGTGSTLDYRANGDVGEYVRARLVSPAGSETGTQPFLLA